MHTWDFSYRTLLLHPPPLPQMGDCSPLIAEIPAGRHLPRTLGPQVAALQVWRSGVQPLRWEAPRGRAILPGRGQKRRRPGGCRPARGRFEGCPEDRRSPDLEKQQEGGEQRGLLPVSHPCGEPWELCDAGQVIKPLSVQEAACNTEQGRSHVLDLRSSQALRVNISHLPRVLLPVLLLPARGRNAQDKG